MARAGNDPQRAAAMRTGLDVDGQWAMGNGQWAVQGPIVTEAAIQLGAGIPRVAMAVAVGEVWTNTIQPLFAVPVLAIAGLHLRHFMGYCVTALLTLAPIYLVALLLF